MLPSLVTVDDLRRWMPPAAAPVDGAPARAEMVCAGASALVRAATGRTWVDDSDELVAIPDDVFQIAVMVAARMWVNPIGVRSESVGPFQVAHGSLLTDAETAVLRRYRPDVGLVIIPTTRGPVETGSTAPALVNVDNDWTTQDWWTA